MHCKSCDQILSDIEMAYTESILTHDSPNFIDLCGDCHSASERAAYGYHVDASDFDIEFNDGQEVVAWLQ